MSDVMTWLVTKLFGKLVGTDQFGNRYYTGGRDLQGRPRRWVVYRSEREASQVPPLYHGWLHHTLSEFPNPDETMPYRWMREHQPNPTGSEHAHRPAGLAPDQQIKPSHAESWRP
ncbi:MAG: NADH-ubiquinone oxidoreductase subunit NDUFA12 family protein [Pseudomonadota bacterium]